MNMILAHALLLLAHPAPLAGINLVKLSAPHPSHCLAADQWRDPGAHDPFRALDGDATTEWWLCDDAALEAGYSVALQFGEPVAFDKVRLHVGQSTTLQGEGSKKSAVAGARPVRFELSFFNRKLSERFPIYTRAMSVPPERATVDLGLPGPLRWNPALINDEDFGDRKRAAGYGAEVPYPLTVDGVTISFQEIDGGMGGEVILKDLIFFLGGEPLVVKNLEEQRQKHLAYIELGLTHILDGRYLVGPKQVLYLGKSGVISGISPPHWLAGNVTDKTKKRLGTWRIAGQRLEFTLAGKKPEPVHYAIDDAPSRVELRSGPLAGAYRVSVAPRASGQVAGASDAPAGATPGVAPPIEAAPPTLGNEPGYEPPPLLE